MRYAEYKDTGNRFIPSIPLNWSIKSGRYCFEENALKNSDLSQRNLLQFTYGTIVRKNNQEIPADSEEIYRKYTKVIPNDIMLNGLNLNYDFVSQRVGIVRESGIITSAYLSLRCHDVYNPYYANYVLKSFDAQKIFHGMGSGVRLTLGYTEFSKISFPVPPKDEQDQIVRYLDWKVSCINKLITGYQREIKLLEERLKAKIAFMVTHDRFSEERRRSEIYWLKDIPANWRVTRLKHILNKQDRQVVPHSELLICSNSGEVKLRGDTKLGLVADDDAIYQGVSKGDLLIHGMDTWHGAIAISNYDGMCTPVVHVCTSTQSTRFICYYLRMMAFTKVFKAISNGVRQNTSDFRSWDKAGALWIALPSFQEQEAIADILDQEVEKTSVGITALKKQIEIMKEYRTRLISDVVTGQMDVRDIVIPDYTPVEEVDSENGSEEEEVMESAD